MIHHPWLLLWPFIIAFAAHSVVAVRCLTHCTELLPGFLLELLWNLIA